MCVLHSLEGHAFGFHDLINFLNLLKELQDIKLFGTRFLGQDILLTVSHNELFVCFLLN